MLHAPRYIFHFFGRLQNYSNCESFTLAKLKMPISQQGNMVETKFKNWHVQENQLYKLGNIWRSIN